MEVVLVLEECHDAHVAWADPRPGDRLSPANASRRLAALRRIAEQRGARSAQWHRCTPTNVARNYYDGGRDFVIEQTLELTFASVEAAVGLLTAARPALTAWLSPRGTHFATLRIDCADIALGGEDDVDWALTLLVLIADAASRPTRQLTGP